MVLGEAMDDLDEDLPGVDILTSKCFVPLFWYESLRMLDFSFEPLFKRSRPPRPIKSSVKNRRVRIALFFGDIFLFN